MDHENNTDSELLKRMCKDNNRAFRAIYNRYWIILYDAAFKRLGDLRDAEEIVQDVFISLYQRRNELEIKSSLKAYLLTAVKYRVFNKFRKWMREGKIFKIQNLDDVDYKVYPIYRLEEKQIKEYFSKAIDKLPPKCKEVFLLSRNNDLTNKQVAERLGISINTVEKHIGKALQILRHEMNKYRFGSFLYLMLVGEMIHILYRI